MARNRKLALVPAIAATLVAAAVLLWPRPDPGPPGAPPSRPAEAAPGSGGEPTPADPGDGERGADAEIEEIRARIREGGQAVGLRLGRLRELGPRALSLLPDLERIVAEKGEGYEAVEAMVGVMLVEGSRKYMRRLAEHAFEDSGRAENHLERYFPATAGAVLASVRLARSADAPAGMKRLAELVCADPAAAASHLAERIEAAPHSELAAWLEVLRGYRPLPAGVGDALRRCLLSEEPPIVRAALNALAENDVDASSLEGPLLEPLLRNAREPGSSEWLPALLALGNLGTEDPRALEAVTDALRGNAVERIGAIGALERLGRHAAGAVTALIRHYRDPSAPGGRSVLEAILGTGSAEAIPLLREILMTRGAADNADILAVLAGLPRVDGAATLLPMLNDRFDAFCGRVAGEAVVCAVETDPMIVLPHTLDLLVRGLGDPREEVRARSAVAARSATALPPRLSTALVDLCEGGSAGDRNLAVWTMLEFGDLGEAARPFVPTLARLVEEPHLATVALITLAKIDPSDPAFRRELEEYARSEIPRMRRTAVVLLQHVSEPGPEHLSVLRSIAASEESKHRRSREWAEKLLGKPRWQTLKHR